MLKVYGNATHGPILLPKGRCTAAGATTGDGSKMAQGLLLGFWVTLPVSVPPPVTAASGRVCRPVGLHCSAAQLTGCMSVHLLRAWAERMGTCLPACLGFYWGWGPADEQMGTPK
jgi:hypothetical protein